MGYDSFYMRHLAKFAFEVLYGPLAWLYDVVAWMASLGEWQRWGACALAFVRRDDKVLEIAHGPGHLYGSLQRTCALAVGIDRSRQMGLIAHRTIQAGLFAQADASRLPFLDESFDCIVTTFPAPFIFWAETLSDARRVLTPGGRLIIVPGATFLKDTLLGQALNLVYRATGQSTVSTLNIHRHALANGFSLTEHFVRTKRATVTIWACTPIMTTLG